MSNPALNIKGLRKVYHNGFEALKGIELTVPAGSFYALLGPNGAGKSTTIGILSTLLTKTAGSVEIFGVDLDKNPSQAKQLIGVVPQEFNFGMFEKVQDIVIQQAGYYGIDKKTALARCEKYLTLLGLWDKRNTVSRTLSGGMKRRLMIARAMMHEPKLLILDEPTAGVDIELRRSMWEFLTKLNQESGVTIILTTHYLEEAEQLCNLITIIDKGEIKLNTTMQALLSQATRETFVLDVPEHQVNLSIHGTDLINFQWVKQQLEATVKDGASLNDVFTLVSDAGIQVSSMRTKNNRLEERFLSLVGGA